MSDERWITQTEFHDPENDGKGNCVQASVASLLAIPLAAVPNFVERGFEWELWFMDWLEENGWETFRFPGDHAPECLYLASGPSPRGVSHMVVMRDGKLVHDPHPSRAGIEKVDWVRILVPLDPAALSASDQTKEK